MTGEAGPLATRSDPGTVGVTDPRDRNKVMTAREAVALHLRPGATLALGGFGYTRLPMTVVREVIRQRIGDLFLTTCGAAAAMECLAACGLVRRLDTTYVGLEGLQPVAYSLRRQIEDGTIELIEDYDNYSYCCRALAGRYGWPFAPVISGLGSDLLEVDVFARAGLRGRRRDGSWIHPSIPPRHHAVIDDPFDGWGLRPHAFAGGDTTANETNALDDARRSTRYTGEPGVKVVLVPPVLPEVTVVRAQVAGEAGTVRIEGGVWAADLEIAAAARTLIVECEKVVPEAELRGDPEHNSIPAHLVDAVVEQPFGGYPSAVPGYYDYDWDFWVAYSRLNRQSPEAVADWWQRWVGETEDDQEFLATRPGTAGSAAGGRKGWARLFELCADPGCGYKPDLERSL